MAIVSLAPAGLQFLGERHLGVLSTLRRDGSPHAVAVGFTYDPATGLVRIITSGDTQKVRNAERGWRAAVTAVDGARWLSLEGVTAVNRDAAAIADAERRYAARYRPPRDNPRRVVIEIAVDRVIGARNLVQV